MTTTTTMTDLVLTLKSQLAALGDGHDCRSDNERAAYWTRYNHLQRTISGLTTDDVAWAQTELDKFTAARAEVVAKQQAVMAELTSAPDLTTIADARDRDREWQRQDHLQQQLVHLARGTLWSGPNQTYPAVADLDVLIADWTSRRDRAQAQFDAAVAEAERLVS